MVVYQSATIGLQAAVVEGLDLAVQAPVAQVLLGQDGKAVPWLNHYDFGTLGKAGEPVLLAGNFSDVFGDGCCVRDGMVDSAWVGKMTADGRAAYTCRNG